MSDIHNKIRKSNVWTLIKLLTAVSIGFFITVYIIRKLSIEEFGVYSVMFSLIGLVGALASFGIQDILRRFLPEFLQNEKNETLKQIVNYGIFLRLLLSVAVVLIIGFFSNEVGDFLKIERFKNYFMVFGIAIIAYLEAGLLTTILNSLFLHKYSTIANIIYVIFRGGIAIVVLNFGWGIYGLLWVEAISWVFWAVIQWIFYKKFYSNRYRKMDREKIPIKRFIKFGAKSSLNDIGSSVLGVGTDFLIISAYLGPGAVALYAFSDKIMKMIIQILPHVVLVDVMRPSFFLKYTQSGDVKDLERMFNLILKISALTIIPVFFMISATSDLLINIVFKEDYSDAGIILCLLAIFNAINIFGYPTGLVLQSIEKNEIILYSKVFSLINIVISISIVGNFGVIGVVLSTCICTFFKNYYCYREMKKLCEINLMWIGILKITINSIFIYLILVAAKNYMTNIYILSVSLFISCGLYYFATRLNNPFLKDERKFINRVTPTPFRII